MADTSKKFVFRARYGGSHLGEKQLTIVALDFAEALKKANDALPGLSLGETETNGSKYELLAIKRGELIDVE